MTTQQERTCSALFFKIFQAAGGREPPDPRKEPPKPRAKLRHLPEEVAARLKAAFGEESSSQRECFAFKSPRRRSVVSNWNQAVPDHLADEGQIR